MKTSRRFRVALSFPGQKRDYVQQVAEVLARRFGEEAVLYDRFHTAEFANPDLAFELPDLYRKESDLIVAVLCGEYIEREWCGLEWRAIYSHIKGGDAKRVMLFRADEAEIRGLHGLEGFAPVATFQPADAAKLILQRLAINEGKPRDAYLDGKHVGAITNSAVIAPSRLTRKHENSVFEGREQTLADLDALWADAWANKLERARIVSLVAIGGAGKTTVVARWKDALLAKADHGGIERYFDWSFYSQGTRREGDAASAHTAADATVFIAAALKFFGDEKLADSPAAAWDKGARLGELAAQHRTLLVLDGMEPLQHPPGPQAGELKDDALRALLEALKHSNAGLCVITTREQIADLQPTQATSTPRWKLDHLADAAGAAVLRGHGVIGPQSELEAASREVKGHALTLSLMGRYLKLAFTPPDISRRDCFEFSDADAETQNGHAFRVFAAYERWFAKEGRHVELAVLRLLGLFDRPATPDCLAALCEKPALPGLTEPLIGLSQHKWNSAVRRLGELDLIETVAWSPVKVSGYGEKEARAEMAAGRQRRTTNLGSPHPFPTPHSALPFSHSVDAHPLLREYFGAQLQQRGVGTPAHARLFEWLCASVPYWPEGRDGLLPLYQAVAHGCKAGLLTEACSNVYGNRILRGTAGAYAGYSTKRLGLIGLDLAAVACFFVEPWRELASELSADDQAWLLSEAAFSLRALNRLGEARDAYRTNLELRIQRGDTPAALAIAASNLSTLELTLGNVRAAGATAVQSVTLADQSGDQFSRLARRAMRAYTLHQSGRVEESRRLFAEAEAMQVAHQQEYPLLYSVQGYWYCDLLLALVERAAWNWTRAAKRQSSENRGIATFADLVAVQHRAAQTLEWATKAQLSLLAIGVNHLTLGRVQLLGLVVGEPKASWSRARMELDIALSTLRDSNSSDDLPNALLPSAWFHALADEWSLSRQRIDESYALATRGGRDGSMKLHVIDTLLHRARLFGLRKDAQGRPLDYPWPDRTPRQDLEEAGRLIDECGYHRRDGELADALAAPDA